MNEQRDFKGVWFPREVWLDPRLTIAEKYYLAVYHQFYDIEKIADEIMLTVYSRVTIIKAKQALLKKGFIVSISDPFKAKDFVLKTKGKGDKCEWCGAQSIALQRHHFPIPQHLGGKLTVLICPNCHAEYHAIMKEEKENETSV